MPFEYDYERFEELLQHHLDAMYHDSDEGSDIGENVSSVEEMKIIFDGYGDLETDDEYIEGGNRNMESFAVFIHKDALTEGFVFPEHDMTPWALIHRPSEEVCIWVWHDVKNNEWEILPLEDRLEDTELNTEQVMTIMEELHDRYFKPIERSKLDNHIKGLSPAAWPFPTGDKK
jgi:hypothetical protein